MHQSEALTPVVLNVDLDDANTEYPVTLPIGTKHFEVRNVSGSEVRVAFETGKVGASTEPYRTVKDGTVLRSPEKMGWSRPS